MLKKVVLILSSLIVLSLPYQQQYVEGAIFSKVASKGAQKIVKEVIKESAFDYAVNIFLDEAFTMALEEKQKYQAQQDYEIFCGKKMPDLITCEKPMQVKSNLTALDKANIGQQAEIELDKLITNGKGFTRWQKFLDWFIPIWVTSFALTAITYAFDPEVRSLFNEAGYNTLVTLGIIKPVTDKTAISPIKESAQQLPSVETQSLTRISTGGEDIQHKIPIPSLSRENMIIQANFNNSSDASMSSYEVRFNTVIAWQLSSGRINFYPSIFGQMSEVTMAYNGQVISTQPGKPTAMDYTVNDITAGINIGSAKISSIMTRLPYQVNGFWYTDILYNTVDGNSLHIQGKSAQNLIGDPITEVHTWGKFSYSGSKEMRTTVFPNQSPYKKILPPKYEELETGNPIKTKYENDKGEIALIPPSALPYTQTSTGIQLTPEIDETTGEQKFTTPTGENVPEDDITVGEPNVQDNPSPAPNTVTPPATQTNPNPEPIPLTPTDPPPPPLTPVETLPPLFPEGESCDVGLKLPKFNPLMHTISDAFPFSIPFDLKDGFDAIFAEMGNEKPEFDYKFNFMGDEQSWKITIPDYFDSWKAFTDSFLIFIFDIGIIYAIYRFMGGGN